MTYCGLDVKYDARTILQSLAMSPPSCMIVPTPSRIRMWVNPISYMESSDKSPLHNKTYLNVLKLRILGKLVKSLHDSEYSHDDIDSAVSLVPEIIELVHGGVEITLMAGANDCLYGDRMGLVADLEDVIARDEAEPRPSGLKVVDGLTHVAFRRKDEGGEAVIVVLDLGTRVSAVTLGCDFERQKIPFPVHKSRVSA